MKISAISLLPVKATCWTYIAVVKGVLLEYSGRRLCKRSYDMGEFLQSCRHVQPESSTSLLT
jgi:hypothetical protein